MLDKTFDPRAVETPIYREWEASGRFVADPASNRAPFTIVIPPPNVTGSLHVGHALDTTLQDVLIRFERMRGRDALWQPGTDHAGIATQLMVERQLAREGTSGAEIGRDAFLDRVWEWKRTNGGTITSQLRRLGASLDWSRERFTMDEGLSRAVREMFVRLHRDGLISRARRLVNWDPEFRSAISDLEVESREIRGSLWHVRYPIANRAGGIDRELSITVATTRPETMLADTAVAVHPDDPRFADHIGREVLLPLTGRRIPIVADPYSDPEKGTGAVKITPAHDFNDFEVGRRHGLAMPTILDVRGGIDIGEIEADLACVEGIADPAFVRGLAGQDRDVARRTIVAELDRLGLLVETVPHLHQVPHAERSGVVVEPRLTTQWYCDAARLAGPAIEAVETGRTVFHPRGWENTFFAWMRDIQPWCISRQLWWGHRIPAWYGPDNEVFVALDAAGAQAMANAHYGTTDVAIEQDPDVLDTWFSSALWPFSTLGWPDHTPELARYYPTDVLVTGFDIIFFWVARMMMMGLHAMGDVPFRNVVIHGLVRDERGQKMSKSKGNGLDPLEVIDAYGADATRFAICALTGPGRDVRLGPKRVEEYRSFVTKLWNAARFCEMNGILPTLNVDLSGLTAPLARWIVAESAAAVAAATTSLEAFRFDEYAQLCYRFVWNTFCDWFLELAKPALASDGPATSELRKAGAHVLGVILRLLHPAMPFVTETLADRGGMVIECGLIASDWPHASPIAQDDAARTELTWATDTIGAIRAMRAALNVPASARLALKLRDADPATLARVETWREPLLRMARLETIETTEGDAPEGSARLALGKATGFVELAGIVDLTVETARLEREISKLAVEIDRLDAKLARADFVQRAKPEVVEETRERREALLVARGRLVQALG